MVGLEIDTYLPLLKIVSISSVRGGWILDRCRTLVLAKHHKSKHLDVEESLYEFSLMVILI